HLPYAAHPRAGRVRHRVQDPRRGRPPARPGARPARPGRLNRRPAGPAQGAHLRLAGAGFAGVEALAELEDMATDAGRYFPAVERPDMSWFLVEATDRILPEVGPEMGRWTTRAGSGPRPS